MARVRSPSGEEGVLLVEAKSRGKENAGPQYACDAGETSRKWITRQLDTVKGALGVELSINWLADYYQHANRIAHLWFLHAQGIPTWLVYTYFLRDRTVAGAPKASTGGKPALRRPTLPLPLPRGHPPRTRTCRAFPAPPTAPF